MPITIPANLLDGTDLGKTIGYPGLPAVGVIKVIEHSNRHTMVEIAGHEDLLALKPGQQVTITGQASPAAGPMGDLQDIAKAAIDHTTRLAKELRETVQGPDPEEASSTPHLPPPISATSHAAIRPRGEDQGRS